jgi:hypothetical protein
MVFAPRVTLAMLLVGTMAMVAVTNLWPNFEYGYLALGQTDTESYRAIAQAAPGVPEGLLPYHHAQRFWIYWLIGVIADISGFSIDFWCRVAVFVFLFGIAWTLWRILQLIGLTPRWQAVIAIGWACNPYCTRYFLAVPWMTADLLFAFGFSITLLGILQRKVSTVAFGLVIAAFGRQTALAIMMAMWIAVGWRQHYKELRTSDIAAMTLASTIVIAIYWAGGWFADGAINENVDTLTGLAVWLFTDQSDKLRQLMEFGLRSLVSQATGLVLLFVLLAKRTRPLPVEFWIVAILVLSVWAQPILAGPEITGNNISRLGSFAYIGLLAMGALVASECAKNLAPWAAWTIAIALVCGSFHHRWSWPGHMLLQTPEMFAILSASMAALVGIAAFFGNNVVSREISILEPKDQCTKSGPAVDARKQ